MHFRSIGLQIVEFTLAVGTQTYELSCFCAHGGFAFMFPKDGFALDRRQARTLDENAQDQSPDATYGYGSMPVLIRKKRAGCAKEPSGSSMRQGLTSGTKEVPGSAEKATRLVDVST